MDVSTIAAALAEMEGCADDMSDDPAGVGHNRSLRLERRLRQQDCELATARARVAELEAATVQARLG